MPHVTHFVAVLLSVAAIILSSFTEISGLLATAALKYCNLLVWQRTVRIAQWPP